MRLIAAFLAMVLLAGCSGLTGMPTKSPSVGKAAPISVAYYVDGTASSVNVTYATSGGTSQAEVDLPLTNKAGDEGIQMTTANAPNFLYISAQNTGESGNVRCRIVVDSVVVAQNTASGAYMIATCQYSL